MIDQLLFNDYKNSNHASLGELINSLFQHCTSELLAIRINVNYKVEYRDRITLEMVQEHRRHLFDNRRRNTTLFGDLLGYGWCLEYGVLSGFHHHLLLLFDGQQRRSDINLGLSIAKYIDTVITGGMSHSHVSNVNKHQYERDGTLGVGAIAHNEITLRNNLLNIVAGYMTKGSIHDSAREFLPDGTAFRTFGRSALPRPKPNWQSHAGRPRSTEVIVGMKGAQA